MESKGARFRRWLAPVSPESILLSSGHRFGLAVTAWAVLLVVDVAAAVVIEATCPARCDASREFVVAFLWVATVPLVFGFLLSLVLLPVRSRWPRRRAQWIGKFGPAHAFPTEPSDSLAPPLPSRDTNVHAHPRWERLLARSDVVAVFGWSVTTTFVVVMLFFLGAAFLLLEFAAMTLPFLLFTGITLWYAHVLRQRARNVIQSPRVIPHAPVAVNTKPDFAPFARK